MWSRLSIGYGSLVATTEGDQHEATAWHEAGHAVAYVVHRLPFRYVTLRPRDRSSAFGALVVRPALRDGLKLAVGAAAGPLAEERYYRQQGHDEDEARWLVDFFGGAQHDADTIARAWPGPPEALDDLTRAILASHWQAVDRVAGALLSSPRALTRATVEKLVTP